MDITCPTCGATMTQTDPRHYECECGEVAYVYGDYMDFRSDSSSPDEWNDEHDEDSYCRVCGNEAYPKCKAGCSFYDD